MSSLRLYAPPCCDWASSSSLARRWAIVFSRRWRENSMSQRTASVRARRAGASTGTRGGAAGGDLDGHLVGGAADTPRADLERGGQRLDRDLERLYRVLAGLLAED